MKLYYTGAVTYEGSQLNPNKSLGGYPSSSQVPLEGLDQLFGAISQQDMRDGNSLTKAVVLKNETSEVVEGASIYYKNNSQYPISNYRVALSVLSVDDCDKLSMSSINTPYDKPLNAIFIDCRNEDGSLTFPTIQLNQYIGIWIERNVNIAKGNEQLSCDFLLEAHDGEKISQVSQYTFNDTAVVGKHFTLDTITNKYVIWFDDGTGQIPQIAGSYELLIIRLDQETTQSIAEKVSSKINNIVGEKGEVSVTSQQNKVIVTNQQQGQSSDVITDSLTIDYQIITQGQDSTVEKIESVELVIEY